MTARPPLAAFPAGSRLTDTEKLVLMLAAKGRTNGQIGKQMHVTEHTVKSHMRHILRRLDATDRTSAVVQAIRTGQLACPCGGTQSAPS